ncbi:MAG: hypothetical protein ABR589_02305, partial [Chthoniobacterales bacterium]
MRLQIICRLSILWPLLASTSLAADPPVQLLLPSRQLEPASTFEVRFAAEMVRPDQIGKPAEPSPLVIAPAVPGRFVWLSTRSGTFAPDGVLPLGTKFTISFRPGLRTAAGKELPAKLRETAETPPFRVKGASAVNYIDKDNASVLPRYLVLFNANVNAAAAAKYCRFVNAAGMRVEARVEQAEDQRKRERVFPVWQSDDRSLLTWGEKPGDAAPEAEEESEGGEPQETDLTRKAPPPRHNVLFVAAAKPLPPGAGWRLVLGAGLPAADRKLALPIAKEVEIGTVQPFNTKSVVAESNRVDGRRIVLEFNKQLAEDVTAETVGKWIKVEPAPAKLKPSVQGTTVTIKGDFALDRRYRVTVAQGLPAREPDATKISSSHEVAFEKIQPRLYFSDFSTHQFTGGSRQLRLVAVNVPRLRVSAKLFTGEAIPVAVKAYDKYEEPPQDLADESYSRVNVEELPGKVIWGQDFAPDGAVDADQTISLNWNEIIGAHRTGAVLLTAESVDPLSPEGKRVGTQSLVQLTDLGAVWKRDPDATFLHVFSLATGKGVAAARLRLLDTDGK